MTFSKPDEIQIVVNDLGKIISYRTIVDIVCVDCTGPMITTPAENREGRGNLAGWHAQSARVEGQSFRGYGAIPSHGAGTSKIEPRRTKLVGPRTRSPVDQVVLIYINTINCDATWLYID